MQLAWRAPRRCFSLVELLVVIGTIGLLVGLLLPAVQAVRASADRIACLSHLKQIGLALHHYHDTQGRLPAPALRASSSDPSWVLNWMALILPHLEQEGLWSASVQACTTVPYPWQNPPHLGLATVLPPYVCPADSRLRTALRDRDGITAAYTSYLGVAGGRGQGGVLVQPGIRLSEVTDGTSNTLMVGERPPPETLQAGQWYPRLYFGTGAFGHLRGPDGAIMEDGAIYPRDFCAGPFRFGPGHIQNPCDRYHFWSLHPGGANFLLADGSARYLPYSAQPVIGALATRNGGEVVNVTD